MVSEDTVPKSSLHRAGFILDHDPAAAALVFAGQRAMWTALLLVEQGDRVNGEFKRGSVSNGFVSKGWPQRVREAGLILDHRADLAQGVLAGDLALDNASATGRTGPPVTEPHEGDRRARRPVP